MQIAPCPAKADVNASDQRDFFLVVHPLDDVPEAKLSSANLPPLEMTRSVRCSLFLLRAYLLLMMLLLLYHVLDLAGALDVIGALYRTR